MLVIAYLHFRMVLNKGGCLVSWFQGLLWNHVVAYKVWISAIPHRNSGWIGTPCLSASRIFLIKDFSLVSVNLWLLICASEVLIMVWSQQAECEGVDSGTLNIPAASKIDLVFFSFHAVIVICILDFLDKSILGSNSGNITHWNWLIWIFSGCSGNSQPTRICSSPVDYVTTEPRKLSGPSQGRVLRRLRVLRWLTGLGRPTKYKRSREPNCGEDQANEMPKKQLHPRTAKAFLKGSDLDSYHFASPRPHTRMDPGDPCAKM